VRRQLVADVPVGLFLSGGIDSTLILSKVARERPDGVDAYCAVFEDQQRSELPFAKEAADRLGARLTVVPIGPEEFANPEHLVAMFDEPFADVAMPAVAALSRAARKSVTVVLTGDGGDEIFGGYETHIIARHLAVWERVVRPLSAGADRVAQALPNSSAYRSRTRALRRGLSLIRGGWANVPLLRGNLSAEERDTLLLPEHRTDTRPFSAVLPRLARGPMAVDALFDPLDDRVLGDVFLHKSDIATMASGLESRAPFLDRALIDFAARLPLRYLVRGGQGKWIMRELLKQNVGSALARRRKTGFSPPLDTWLRREHLPLLNEYVARPTNLIYDWVAREPVARRLREHASGAANHRRVLWSLLLLEAFLRRAAPTASRANVP
jgi:asparagine synthase (glutamine-hydrolysing)